MMMSEKKSILVAGHICLDIIPSLDGIKDGVDTIFVPGKLFTLPPAILSTGGAVPNTGCALHRLGIKTKLVGKIGDDVFGLAIQNILRKTSPDLADNLIIVQGGITAHAITLSAAGTDRIFLCCPGANDDFTENDLTEENMAEADILHFGYPPLLEKMYEDSGDRLEKLLSHAKSAGLTVSLDMSKPDPDSKAGKVNWRAILERVLPYVDIFTPSLDEIIFMLDTPVNGKFHKTIKHSDIYAINIGILDDIAAEMLALGPAIVAIKLGSDGLYLRTTDDSSRFAGMGRGTPQQYELWTGRQLLSPCFAVNASGTTGAGDTTIAGLLAAVARSLTPQEAMTSAVAAGACCVEQHDAVSGIPTWENLTKRIGSGWLRRKSEINMMDWRWNEKKSIWHGPEDSGVF